VVNPSAGHFEAREEFVTRRFGTRAKVVLIAAGLTASLLGQTPASSQSSLPQAANGLTVPQGFGAGIFAATPGFLPSSLTFGPDGRLYVATVKQGTGGFISDGQIVAFEDLGGVGGPPQIVAEGFGQLLGITFGPDGTLYATDNNTTTFTGQIIALRDTSVPPDGTYDQRHTVLRNIPNGRHQTNGMAFGPDGALYVANGNATDDGIECGPPDSGPGSTPCGSPEKKPWTGAILRVDPTWKNVDLQTGIRVDGDGEFAADGLDDESVLVSPGYRNIYDVDFWPGDPSMIYTPMNGSDSPASNEPLFRTDVDDTRVVRHDDTGAPVLGPVIEDAGFPSCLWGSHPNSFPLPDLSETGGLGHDHPENFEPGPNTNPAVIERFGPCQPDKVMRPIMFFREAHNGTSGMAFERGGEFPQRYDGDLFVAEWGSLWNLNGGVPTGHKITHVDIDPETGLALRKREFMTGVLPMDVTFGPDGGMYVADMQGLIYRVVHVLDTSDTATVEMVAGQFVPSIVAIPRDTSVLWVNLDTVAHNVRTQVRVIGTTACVPPANAGTCSEMDSPGDVPPRGSYRYTFGNTEGVWQYTSDTDVTDATMQGTIVVTPTDQ
jgi:glucose/arabinose dehydrogenase/plastocyanin